MKIVEINGTNYSSTGNISLNIAQKAREEGFVVYTCCKNSRKTKQFDYDYQIYIGNRYERLLSEQVAAISGYESYFNYFGTKSFINKLKKIKPDLIHMHVMHSSYINLMMLFEYIKENNIPVIWTFHDCWAFTGKCPYFETCNCTKWKNGCYECPQTKKYPESYFFDKTKHLWNKKKQWFTSLDRLNIVTPTKWLKEYVEESFLNKYPVQVIHNGIDLSIFKPTEKKFKKEYNLENKHILLGVGHNWADRKGLDDFIELSKRLDDKYQIVIVGTNEEIDKLLPSNIISIHRTYDQKQLADIYSSADLFVNPTKEDNLPTVNIESLACGTPVLTYNTGGSPEIIDEKCGSVVEKGDIDALEKEIKRICTEKPFDSNNCVSRSKVFDKSIMSDNYIKLYKEVLKV